MKYAMSSKNTPESMAYMCQQGCCFAKAGFFLCPFGCRWPDTASKCGKVTAEMWIDQLIDKPSDEENEARQNMIHYLARQGAVKNLIRQLSKHDIINRMSLEGELQEIETMLQWLKEKFPKVMEDLLVK